MRFIDEATIRVFAGHGGPGCVSFRREVFVPRGGPDGGDGGAGGDVVFAATKGLSTLQDFRFKREYRAPAGMHGSGTNKAGKDGDNIVIKIPLGTMLKDAATGEVLHDFMEEDEQWVACQGGRGGKGNAHFVTSTFQAPRFAQPGEEGQAREFILELKLLADVAILGFPNAGKSTLISRISAARPKVGDYPFTTLTPNLGVVAHGDLPPFVVADIPGLVEGAHRGRGLGHKFLKHIERTRLFVHLLDGTKLLEDLTEEDLAGEDAAEKAIEHLIERYCQIREELRLFNDELIHKPEIVVLNKGDLFESDPEFTEKARKALRQRINSIRGTHPVADEPLLISSATGAGVAELLNTVVGELKSQTKALDEKEVFLPNNERIRSNTGR